MLRKKKAAKANLPAKKKVVQASQPEKKKVVPASPPEKKKVIKVSPPEKVEREVAAVDSSSTSEEREYLAVLSGLVSSLGVGGTNTETAKNIRNLAKEIAKEMRE